MLAKGKHETSSQIRFTIQKDGEEEQYIYAQKVAELTSMDEALDLLGSCLAKGQAELKCMYEGSKATIRAVRLVQTA